MANLHDKSETRKKVNKRYQKNKSVHITCKRCGRVLNGDSYFTMKDGNYYDTCKVCLTSEVDSRKPKTFLPILKTFDVPFIKEMWLEMCKKQYIKNPEKYSSSAVFGTYLRTMKMGKYGKFGYDDAEEASEVYRDIQDRNKSKKYDTFMPESEVKPIPQSPISNVLNDRTEEAKVNETPEKVSESLGVEDTEQCVQEIEKPQEQPVKQDDDDELDFSSVIADVRGRELAMMNSGGLDERKVLRESEIASELTQDDVLRLSLKWGDDYRPTEWIRMEETYRRYANEFEMNVDREEVLKKMCKTSLKMDQALDDGNIADYTKLQTAFDSLRKSGKFTEAQNKDKEDRYLDSVGELVAAVEREGGIIPKFNYKYEAVQDKVDLTIRDCQSYLYNLVRNEMGLGNLIETYIQKLDQQAAQTITTSLGDGLVTSRSEEEEADRAADNWMVNLQASIENDANRIFSQLDDDDE